jgi:hypothetical protein
MQSESSYAKLPKPCSFNMSTLSVSQHPNGLHEKETNYDARILEKVHNVVR